MVKVSIGGSRGGKGKGGGELEPPIFEFFYNVKNHNEAKQKQKRREKNK